MAWQLEIHTIDVGQGESSLIIAYETGVLNPRSRTMLIDGGLAGQAATVHAYIAARGVARVDHVLLSHFDDDHSGGIIALLIADNLTGICDSIAVPTATYAAQGNTRQTRLAAGAAVAWLVMNGVYGTAADGADLTALYQQASNAARGAIVGTETNPAAIDVGIHEATLLLPDNANATIVASSRRIKPAVVEAANAAVVAINGGQDVRVAVRNALFASLRTAVPENSRFQTGGIYANAHVIDIGDSLFNPAPEGYANVVGGQVLMSTAWKKAPGINRDRLQNPGLGAEILWNSGPLHVAAPASSPAIFVMACQTEAWHAPDDSEINSGQRDNDASIGLILRFNKFFYYTGGDLPSQGEDLIADAIMANRIPNPQGGNAFALPIRVACFKCGHHGSNASTSQHFLDTVHPRAALISCGFQNAFGHPGADTIGRLQASDDIQLFFLTECEPNRDHIPASMGQGELTAVGNKSRLSGDDTHRGNIVTTINEAESNANADAQPAFGGPVQLRQFHVTYFEGDDNVEALRTETLTF